MSSNSITRQGSSGQTRKLTSLAIFSALIVVLQLLSTFIKFGPFSITLALIPIVVGGALYGPKVGATLGGVFGLVVLIACIFGWDIGGNILWLNRPFITVVLCIGKGALAGFCSGAVYGLVSKKNATAATFAAAIVCPLVNTGVFCLGMLAFYYETLTAWAGGTAVIVYILTGLVGINFLVELAVNLVLSPTVLRIIKARKP